MGDNNKRTKHSFLLGSHSKSDGPVIKGKNPGARAKKLWSFWGRQRSGSRRNCVRQFLWFADHWKRSGYPEYVDLRIASLAMGLSSSTLYGLKKSNPQHIVLTSLEISDEGVFVPSLIDQIKWIPIRDVFLYLGMNERSLRYFVIYTDLYTEVRDFRGCRCIEIDEVMKLGIWKRLQGWTKRRLKVKFKDGLAYLPIDALVSFMKTVGDVIK